MNNKKPFEEMSNLSPVQLQQKGREIYASLKKALAEEGYAEEAEERILDLVSFIVSIDHFSSKEEYFLYKAIFGGEKDYDAFLLFAQTAMDEGRREEILNFYQKLGHATREFAFELALCFMSSDGNVEEDERELLLKIRG